MKTGAAVCLALFLAGAISPARGVTLDFALAQTLEKNPHIQQAKTALEAAAGERLILRSVAYPKGLIGGIAGVQGGRRAQTSTQPFAFAYGAFLQPLFHAGIPASFRRGDVALLIAQQELNVTVVEELHRARLAFYSALYQRSLESLGRSQRARLDENIAGEKARYEAGESERGALTSATLLARELDPKIESARSAYGSAVVQLVQSMGGDLGAGATLPSPEGSLDFQTVDLRAENEVERGPGAPRRFETGSPPRPRGPRGSAHHRGRLLPGAECGRLRRSDSRLRHSSRQRRLAPVERRHRRFRSAWLALSYTWRVIDNGKVSGEVAQQRAARETNELQLQKLETNVPRELARLQNNLRAIAARYRSLLQAADVAEQNVASIQENRAQGLASVLDFRNAESSLLVTRRGILSAIYEQKVALAEWDRATGRYFQFSGDTSGKVH